MPRVVAPTGDERPAPQEHRPRARQRHGTAQRRTAYDFLEAFLPRSSPPAPDPRRRLKPFHANLVHFIFKHRLALSTHVHERFREWLPTLRTAQRHLKDLRSWGHVAVVRVRDRALKRLHIYYVTAKGRRLVRDAYLQRLGKAWEAAAAEDYGSKGRAADTVVHDLLAAQFSLDTWLTVLTRPDLTLRYAELRWAQRLAYSGERGVRHLEPDFGFLLTQQCPEGRRRHLWHLTEVDLGTKKVPDLRGQLHNYADWWETAGRRSLRTPKASPDQRELWLLFAAHNRRTGRDDYRQRDVMVLGLEELPPALHYRTLLTTVAELAAHRQDGPPLAARIWLRLGDVYPYLAADKNPFRVDYRQHSRRLEPGRQRLAFQRRFMDWLLGSGHLKRYTLLPPPIEGSP